MGTTKTAIYNYDANNNPTFSHWEYKENNTPDDMVIDCPYIPIKLIKTKTDIKFDIEKIVANIKSKILSADYKIKEWPNFSKITNDIVEGR